MNKCYDMNNVLLHVDDLVSYVENGDDEDEGPITELLPNNQIVIDGDSGLRTINASNCFSLEEFLGSIPEA